MSDLPLSQLTVLEVSTPTGGAGPIASAYGGALLAGLGADVIRVEPLRGDPARRRGPFPHDIPQHDRAAEFHYLNGAKRSLALDLGSAAGRRLVGDLAARVEILIHDAPPAGAADLGLDDASLRARQPALIHCAVSPFGQDGPYRDHAATDLQHQALSGLLDLTGEPHREPLALGAPLAEYAAGEIVAVAVLTALRARRAHAPEVDRGEFIDVSVLEAACSIIEHSMAAWQYRGIVRRRSGNWGGVSAWGIYPCADGFVGVVSGLGDTFHRFRELIGGPLLEERFASIAARTELADEMDAAIVTWLARRSKEEAFHAAQRQGIPFSALSTPADVLQSAQLRARGYLAPLSIGESPAVVPGAPFLIDGDGWRKHPGPGRSQQRSSLLRELGLDRSQIVQRRRAGVLA